MLNSDHDETRDGTEAEHRGVCEHAELGPSQAATSEIGPVRKLIYAVLAAICILLALLGVVLPGLPTTPFLLLASYLLVRSFPSFNEALLKSRLFGPILNDWQVHGGVRTDIKVKAIVFVIIAVSLSAYLMQNHFWIQVTLLSFALVGVIIVIRLPRPNLSESGRSPASLKSGDSGHE